METNFEDLTKKERRALRREERHSEESRDRRARIIRRGVIWSCALLLLSGAVLGIIRLGGTSPSNENETAGLVNAVTDADWHKGDRDAAVTLVEYSDFQCPACGAYYPILKQLTQEFGDRIHFVYRHFPLSRIHKNARAAAQAAEAAGKQGKFWEMHDMLFERQRVWAEESQPREIFIEYAQSLGLDAERFAEDSITREIEEKVSRDYDGGVEAGVGGTPTFFLNGTKIQNPRSYDEFKSIIEDALAAHAQ